MSSKHVTNILSRLFGHFAAKPHPAWLQRLINRSYVRMMGLDMQEFSPPEHYASLQALFTRPLSRDRTFNRDDETVISPCDARITHSGTIAADTLFQIKGMRYSLEALLPQLGRDQLGHFEQGPYLNLYLSPKDYHRYHAPATLTIRRLVHIPGRLWPVNLPFLKKKPNLFIENERVVLECEDPLGRAWMLVFVGALNVGRMHFVHLSDFQSNLSSAQMSIFELDRVVKKGDLLGWFEMGSTILIITQPEAFEPAALAQEHVRYGEMIGSMRS